MRKFAIAAAVIAASLASTAPAAITVYTSLAAFTAATTAPGVDTFNGFSISGSTASPITRTAGAYTYRASTSDLSPTGATGFYGAGTTTDTWLSTNYALDTVTFNGFSSGVSAVGGQFFTSDVLGAFAAGGVTLTALDSLGATTTQTIAVSSTTSFLGFVSTGSISSLTLASIQGANAIWPTANNLVLARAAASAVPEPTSWALMIGGFGLTGGMMRRRVSKVAFA